MLTRLTVRNVRNLIDANLSELSQINLIHGENGAGKTSLLEAIHLLATARSFRHSQARPVIRHQQESMLVTARWTDRSGLAHQSGIERWQDGRMRIRCDGERVATAAELAALLPIQVLNAESFSLIEGSPSLRRQFFDWGVFHVEHRFFPIWSVAQRALRQRNALLKHGRIDRSAWELWTAAYAEPGMQLQELRAEHFERLERAFQEALAAIAPELTDEISLGLYSGWGEGRILADVLEAERETDLQRGYTRAGPHRADLRIKAQGLPAQEVLSRGQIKIVSAALKLAQGKLLYDVTGRRCLYLIDDLAAELDRAHRQRLGYELARIGAQVFVTALSPEDLSDCWPQTLSQSPRMFHVEHGVVNAL